MLHHRSIAEAIHVFIYLLPPIYNTNSTSQVYPAQVERALCVQQNSIIVFVVLVQHCTAKYSSMYVQ